MMVMVVIMLMELMVVMMIAVMLVMMRVMLVTLARIFRRKELVASLMMMMEVVVMEMVMMMSMALMLVQPASRRQLAAITAEGLAMAGNLKIAAIQWIGIRLDAQPSAGLGAQLPGQVLQPLFHRSRGRPRLTSAKLAPSTWVHGALPAGGITGGTGIATPLPPPPPPPRPPRPPPRRRTSPPADLR